jgi:hypothetical protein
VFIGIHIFDPLKTRADREGVGEVVMSVNSANTDDATLPNGVCPDEV